MQATIPGTVRLLVDPPAAGAYNMALDEALLEALAGGQGLPTLRFYDWSPPALSLGYAQPVEVVDRDACRRWGVDVVRRPTGGRAVLHDRELTYSVVMRAGGESVADSYCRISKAIARALAAMGVPAEVAAGSARKAPGVADCFAVATPADLVAGSGRKLAGSAQVRRHGRFLQHGSIKLAPSPIPLGELLPGQAAPSPATVADYLGTPAPDLAGRLMRAIAAELGVPWEPAAPTAAELHLAAIIAARTSSVPGPADRVAARPDRGA
ncbi:MAG: lipoate--protein ligase family protein [Candidatus Sericytochromatia bacterium]|nr:lipoate--protein ligase family protein [Candidatus Tanganyikabacteria bacterium]